MPLFLELVRLIAQHDPGLARAALDGLALYEQAARSEPAMRRTEMTRVGPAALRECGGSGPPALLVPSLINPPHILDLDAEVSLANAIARMGRRALLLDWGVARERSQLDIAGHVSDLLVALIAQIGEPVALVGYCLGGTMAIAAANIVRVERVVTLATPWHFDGYPSASREGLRRLWASTKDAADTLDALPMEILQAAFWSLDPERTVRKFASFAELAQDSPEARRFVALEDWANEGEPLPCPAARELIEDFFGRDLPGRGEWVIEETTILDRLSVPTLHLTASEDRITPAAAAPGGECVQFPSGHVGMIVGSKRSLLQERLAEFLDPNGKPE